MTVIRFELAETERFGARLGLWPQWFPSSALAYLAHTDLGVSIRALSRLSQCHPSTISRQISRWERLRDESLIDEALSRLSLKPLAIAAHDKKKEPALIHVMPPETSCLPDDQTFAAEARRILRRLSEPGAVLALASDMEKGVVVRETEAGTTTRTAVVERALAQALAVKDWIVCAAEGRITRYRITSAGRAALGELLAKAENHAQGFAEGQVRFDSRAAKGGARRAMVGETPLMILSRRREKDGELFLAPAQVSAGERLREDFELAQMVQGASYDWEALLEQESQPARRKTAPLSAEAAANRVATALLELGPGLGHIVLRCCCELEGLETAERGLGWSARSGKIVLRIALERLGRYYVSLGERNKMIG
ncbi:DUF6456 domain-containing protein [Lentibacter algarum]|uniref:DUF6456 domain-containing protein n=1 Tax=Lentibacter algarum TaxID=576131 RepID=UPI003BAE1B9D